jgi:hypothetical protein
MKWTAKTFKVGLGDGVDIGGSELGGIASKVGGAELGEGGQAITELANKRANPKNRIEYHLRIFITTPHSSQSQASLYLNHTSGQDEIQYPLPPFLAIVLAKIVVKIVVNTKMVYAEEPQSY